MPTKEDVIHRWPTLEKVTNADEWNAALADAAAQVDDSIWGRRAELARIHLAAHFLSLGHPALRDPGLIANERVGQVSRGYAVSPLPAGFSYEATPYGREYLKLQRQTGARLPFVL